MAETNNAASSPAEVEDVFRGENVSMAEFTRFRQSGEIPERFKPAVEAESAPADSPEETVASEVEETETAPDSEPEEATQEPPQKGSAAEKRIKQLLAKVKELESKITAPPQDTQASPTAAKTPNPLEPVPFDQEKWLKENPDAQYEDMIKAMVRHEATELRRVDKIQEAQAQAQRDLAAKLADAKTRYEDAEEVIIPATEALMGDQRIPGVIKQVLNDSDVLPDLLYVIGGDLDKFVNLARSNPRAAMAQVFEYERAIREELAKGSEAEAEKTKSGEKAPEKKQTSAPKPPTPVNGGSSRTFDVNDESLTADEWARKRNAQISKRGKG